MGNHRFRLSDMMPNAWFYKLRDMSRTKKHNNSNNNITKKKPHSQTTPTTSHHKQQQHQPRQHYYRYTIEPINNPNKVHKFHKSPQNPKASDTHFPDTPPRKSSITKRPKRRTIYKPSPKPAPSFSSSSSSSSSSPFSPNCLHCQDHFVSSVLSSPESDSLGSLFSEFGSDHTFDEFTKLPSLSTSCRLSSSSTTDIIIDMNAKSNPRKFNRIDGFDPISELEFLKIRTTHEDYIPRSSSSEFGEKEESFKSLKIERGVRIRANSPRIASRKLHGHGRRSLIRRRRGSGCAEGFAIVKSSVDPQRDFRESMVEMIVENNLKGSKELEGLLACYLSLNSAEYHDLIVKAFEQIWLDLTHIQM